MTDEPHSSELHWLDGMVPVETLRTSHMCGRRAPPSSCVRKWARVHRGSTHAVRVLRLSIRMCVTVSRFRSARSLPGRCSSHKCVFRRP